MHVYVSFDGDGIGQKVGRARLADDVEAVRRISQAIDQGNEIWRSWALSTGGSVVEMGGDEGALEIPADRIAELGAIRDQYAGKVGATVSVGVGMKLGESSKALLAAKLKGKDQIVFYSDEADDLIEQAQRNPQSEAGKIADEYLNKASQSLGFKAAFRHPNGQVHVAGNWHDLNALPPDWLEVGDQLESGFVDPTGKYYNRREAAHAAGLPKTHALDSAWLEGDYRTAPEGFRGLKKAAPAMNPGAFAGAARPDAASVDKPVSTQGDSSEMDSLNNVLGDENAPGTPEQTHAAKDFEKQLHDEAWKGEEEDMAEDGQKQQRMEQVKAQVVQALQTLKVQAQIMEQVKQVAPEAYKAMVGLTQSVVAMARELAGPGEKMQKAEGKDKAQKTVDQIRSVMATDLGEPKGAEHCAKGHCYVASEALYHLLGGKEAGWDPHSITHEGGPHWFLKHRGGRVLDPTSDQFNTPIPYGNGKPSRFLTDMPSDKTRQLVDKLLGEGQVKPKQAAEIQGEPVEKGGLPMPGASAHHHVVLPIGSTVGVAPSGAVGTALASTKIKTQHGDGTSGWHQATAGQIMSQDRDGVGGGVAGHAVSSREPNAK